MKSYISEKTLVDLFDHTFKISGDLFKPFLILSLGGVILLSVFMEIAFKSYFQSLYEIIESTSHQSFNEQILSQVASSYGFFIFILLLASIISLLIYISGVQLTSSHMNQQPISWNQALMGGISQFFLKSIGLQLVILLIVLTLLIIPALFFILAISVSPFFSVFALLTILISLVIIYIFSIRIAFAMSFIIIDGKSVVQSLKESFSLTSGWFWRTFGLLFLFNILVSFAISIISTPFTLFSFIGPYIDLIQSILNESNGKSFDMDSLKSFFQHIGIGIGIATAIGMVLQPVFFSIYTTLMFYDLKCRKGIISSPNTQAPEEPSESEPTEDRPVEP